MQTESFIKYPTSHLYTSTVSLSLKLLLTMPLKIVIIGAGIAGLASAAMLRTGSDVTILESGDPSQVADGQGLAFGPNAVKILEKIGYDRQRVRAVESKGLKAYDGATGALVKTIPLDGIDMGRRLAHAAARGLAAGIHTKIKEKIVGSSDYAVTPTGQSIFRFLVSSESARKAAEHLPDWWNPETSGYLSITRLEDESWFANGDIDEVLDIFKDFPLSYRESMKYAEEVKVWELRDHDPLPNYVSGRAVLIGDAAHAMAPFQGQGAGQAIEDAEGLRLLLEPGVAPSDVPNILQHQKLDEVNSFQNMNYNWTYNGINEELKKA
ncbi:unnamed protein product [Clonostachys chloroleuca]|uniref:FAD-binding domain-containing protein n=1 Tax=Clonostachys chloroleuca TaxID=1926264 RepID=A0AA35LPA6_9HYPO|nr:unnamed protein product [Clonostachys chloroleuca]